MPGDGGCDAVLYTDTPHQYDEVGQRYKSYEEVWAQIAGDAESGEIITVKVLPPSNARLRDDPDEQGPAWVARKIASRGEGPFNE